MTIMGKHLFGALALALASTAAAQQNRDDSALVAAAQDCRIDEARALIGRGADVNTANSAEWTPLMMTASYGCLEIAEMLIAAGADPAIRHPSFGTAAELAKMNRYAKIEALLQKDGGAATPAAAGGAMASTRLTAPSPSTTTRKAARGSKVWPSLGAYRVGQEVLFSGTAGKTWDRGIIKSIDPVYGYNIAGWTGSYDPFFVVGAEREPFWTEYFIGDWRISVPMAMGAVTDGTYVYRTLSGGLRLPPLRISADGSYSWRVQQGGGEKLIKGRWAPNPNGPGVVLKNGEKGAAWLVYNNSRTANSLGETIILSSDCCSHYDGSRLK
jgi:hypothetical protein